MAYNTFHFPISELLAEAEEKALYRSKAATLGTEGITPEMLLLSEEDHPIMNEYLREYADNVYTRLKTLLDKETPYEFVEGKRIVFNLDLPENYDLTNLPVLYDLAKNYMVEGVLMEFFTERGYAKGMQICQLRLDKNYDKMMVLRLSRTKPINTRYTVI